MKKEVAIVMDADKNEMFFGENVGECKQWCEEHNVTGQNGEYIALGTFDEESRYFDIEDYSEIA